MYNNYNLQRVFGTSGSGSVGVKVHIQEGF
jgi:hypothetical protein